ncbi:hypothetical protein AGABI2DRAFT_194392 [Agaricus bisporus var. bisporus H97]|uniref:hypothetical protein n=1 Tax=Agaricus bisporus var. bisporus (strain H97 / ATCC MYA-4626 / FGSC 10389) TaxID=936046 RepID=UPI00029F4EA1|nr:hypothetical protein AGABI2DRAFT_194392 [Agaricus bisporus var. bisporus H97]EKV44298.1 hypothetical protein AGABI2DRAFT_194392 [Agaricus bisporus var. bisporus H97]
MATDAPATATEWASLSQEDKIKEQKEMTKILEDPETLSKFSEACKNIGQTAVSIDTDFRIVKNGFAKLVEKYGKDFPDVEKVYVPKWDGFMARWNGSTGILWSSRTLAANTAATLTDYGLNLGLVADIKTEDDLKGAQIELKDYVDKHPIHVAKEVAEGFKNLKSDIQNFSKEFTKYIEDQRQALTDEAKMYEDEIKKCQDAITKLNWKLAAAAINLVVSFALGIVEGLVAIGPLAKVIAERIAAQIDLNKAKANLETTVNKQKALAAMQADFEKFKPNIDDICTKLGIFADIWTFTIEQSSLMNAELQEGMQVLTTEAFQVKLRLLQAQIEPLREGMREYAKQIVPPSK